jgi:hypothetical protein
VLRTEWASNAAGNGGGSFGAAALQQMPKESHMGTYYHDEGCDGDEVAGGNHCITPLEKLHGHSGSMPSDRGERFQYVPEDNREDGGWEGCGVGERPGSPTSLMEAAWKSQILNDGAAGGVQRLSSASTSLVPTQTLTGGAVRALIKAHSIHELGR